VPDLGCMPELVLVTRQPIDWSSEENLRPYLFTERRLYQMP